MSNASDADDLRSLLQAARGMKEEVAGVRQVLKDFYVPKTELNRKLVRILSAAFLLLLLIVGGGTTLTLTSYARLQDTAIASEIEVVEHRIADKNARVADKVERLCLYNALRDAMEAVHFSAPPPPEDPCQFTATDELETQLAQLQALLEDLRRQRDDSVLP